MTDPFKLHHEISSSIYPFHDNINLQLKLGDSYQQDQQYATAFLPTEFKLISPVVTCSGDIQVKDAFHELPEDFINYHEYLQLFQDSENGNTDLANDADIYDLMEPVGLAGLLPDIGNYEYEVFQSPSFLSSQVSLLQCLTRQSCAESCQETPHQEDNVSKLPKNFSLLDFEFPPSPLKSDSTNSNYSDSLPLSPIYLYKPPKPKSETKKKKYTSLIPSLGNSDLDVDTAMALATKAITNAYIRPEPLNNFEERKHMKKRIYGRFSTSEIAEVKMLEAELCSHCSTKFKDFGELIDHYEKESLFLKNPRTYLCPVSQCPMNLIGYDKKAHARHHALHAHFYRGYVAPDSSVHQTELNSMVYVCNKSGCGKGFYRKDSLSRHQILVHRKPKISKKTGKRV